MKDTKRWTEPFIDEMLAKFTNSEGGRQDEDAIRLIASYEELIDSPEMYSHVSDIIVEIAIETADYTLVELGLPVQYAISALIYYPFMSSLDRGVHLGVRALGDDVANIVESMSQIARSFERTWLELLDPKLSDSVHQERKDDATQGAKFGGKRERWSQQTERLAAKMFIQLSGSPETAVLKLVDTMHMLQNLPRITPFVAQRQEVASMAMNTHAKVADALGLWIVKSQIEDAAFKILYPERYRGVARSLELTLTMRNNIIEKAKKEILLLLEAEDISARVEGRVKHLYGISEKMREKGLSLEQINDTLGVRIITNSEGDCYRVLGLIMGEWEAVEGIYERGNFRDWIANPKENGYQSLHTTVWFDGKQLEIQIRTLDMHMIAEYGSAAHWVYKNRELVVRDGISLQEQIAKWRTMFDARQKRL